jgi:pilus assembly protein FimV
MNQPNWRSTVLALATAVLLGVWASDAAALALGRVTVQSALGEPLRADIDIVEINAEEVASLRATVASPEAFRAAGLEYSPLLASIEITLQRRPDGRYFLQLSSQRSINDPFVDLILETQWASGRIVRDYTMLFDPANLRQSPPPVAVQVSPVAPQAPVRPGVAAPAPADRASRQGPVAAAASTKEAARTVPGKGDGKPVKVQSGDTAGKIAAANKPVNVSLDQMLVALLNANPEAFIGGNVNRLKAGAVLEIPSAEQAGQESAGAASQTVIAQSRDFNDFRRRLAEGLATSRIAPSDRQASGKVEAQVQEKKQAAPSPDKLTLSKGAVQGKAVEDKIAREREAKDAAVRLAELNKNISDLNRLGTTTAAPAATATASAGKPVPGATTPAPSASATRPAASLAVPAIAVPAATSPLAAAVPAPAASEPSSAATMPSSSAAAAPASLPAAAVAASPATASSGSIAAATPASSPAIAAKAPPAALPKPVAPLAAEPSLVDDLLQNPIVLAGVGLLVALLAGFGFYKARQRKKATQVDSSFLESRLQPDSFFGASGGQRIDTNEGGATGSSMVYSPSQLDAAGDVDPVAEADVYLAYGRDLQAEEILKEAMRTTPQRVAIHSKLLEIYSKRRDTKAFELVATEAYSLTRGEGPEWEHICELGQELDAGNTLYRPGGQPAAGADSGAEHGTFGSTVATQVDSKEAPSGPVDLDLDLDFSLGDDAPPPFPPEPTLVTPARPEPTQTLTMDFGSTATAAAPAPVATVPISLELPETTGKLEPITAGLPDLELSDDGLTFTTEPIAAPELPAAAPAAAADSGMIEFDLGALSLDLPDSSAPAPAPAPAAVPGKAVAAQAPLSTADAGSTGGFEDTGSSGDPLATKFALAQEFNAIGDPDGARSLAEEVLAEASGDLKHRAQRFLAEIG